MAEQEHDINTQEGFEAFMREAESSTPPEEESTATPAAPEEGVGEEGEAPGGAPPEDDRIAALEEQLRNAEQVIGRQGNELGNLRQALQEEPEEPEEVAYLPDSGWEQLEGLYESQGGAGMMLYLANNAPQFIDAGIALWKENDFRNAELYEKQMNRMAESALASTEPTDPAVARLVASDAQEAAQKTILREYGSEQLQALQPHFEAAMESMPTRLRGVLVEDFKSGDTERVTDAYRTLLKLSEPLAGTDAVTTAAEQRAAASRVAKREATAATGSRAPSGPRESGTLPATREELENLDPEDRRKAAAAIMAKRVLSQQTSVAAGLESSKS